MLQTNNMNVANALKNSLLSLFITQNQNKLLVQIKVRPVFPLA